MKLEMSSSSASYADVDQYNLDKLLETFGSLVSLEEIASAYCQAGRDLCATAEIICNMRDWAHGTSSSQSHTDSESSNGVSTDCQSDKQLENSQGNKSKLKRCSTSMGIVSGVIGRDYVSLRPQVNALCVKNKPVKLHSDEFPVSEVWSDKQNTDSTSRSESMSRDMEEFLFKMLGNGFNLEMSVIQNIVGQCGYNMQMSIDKLLDLSASTLKKSDGIIGTAGNIEENSLCLNAKSSGAQPTCIEVSGRAKIEDNGIEQLVRTQGEKYKKKIGKELLEALFSVPSRVEVNMVSTGAARESRPSPYGRVVHKPMNEKLIEDFTFISRQPVNDKNDEGIGNDYEDLRIAVQEYWNAMKEYYKAALDSFSKNDHDKAQKLMEEGNFFMKKAREADEKSARVLVEDRDEKEEISHNMHELEPRDALRLLRLQLVSLSGLPSISYLKVVVGTNAGEAKDKKRKRLITKLLEKEGIPWTEEGDGWIMSIKVGEIDRKKLSFV